MSLHRAPIFFKPGFSRLKILVASCLLRIFFKVDEKHCRKVVLTEEILRVIYSNILNKKVLWEATKSHLLDKQVIVLIFFVDKNDLERLVRFIGNHVDPRKCSKISLRYVLGGGKEQIPGSGKFWFGNGIHRPRTTKEAYAHLDALFPELCLGTI